MNIETRKQKQIERIARKSHNAGWLVRFINKLNPGMFYRMKHDIDKNGNPRK